MNIPSKRNDLTDLLNEAKLTIIQLQTEIESLKSEVEILRQQNREYMDHIEITNNESSPKTAHKPFESTETEAKSQVMQPNDDPVPIPFEPIIIVKGSKENSPLKSNSHANAVVEHQGLMEHLDVNRDENSIISDQLQTSDNTYVL